MLIEELRAFLEVRNIPLQEWGKGEAKTLEHLFSEISSGEAVLTEEEGALLRSAEGGTLNASIGEKMKRGEDPFEAAYRALSEELDITDRLPLVPKPKFVKGPVPSPSFPGLYTLYTMHVFDVFLPAQLYKPEGYVEHQADKSSYFVWEKFSDSEARA